MYVQNAVKDSIKLRVKCLYIVDLDFCITYLKNTKFNPVTYLTAIRIFLVHPVNCCSNYTNIVSSTIHTGIPCIYMYIFINRCDIYLDSSSIERRQDL